MLSMNRRNCLRECHSYRSHCHWSALHPGCGQSFSSSPLGQSPDPSHFHSARMQCPFEQRNSDSVQTVWAFATAPLPPLTVRLTVAERGGKGFMPDAPFKFKRGVLAGQADGEGGRIPDSTSTKLKKTKTIELINWLISFRTSFRESGTRTVDQRKATRDK